MKKLFFALILLIGWLTGPAVRAQYNNWSVGVRVGEPTGLNVRKYFGSNHAFDLNMGAYGALYGTQRSYRLGDYRGIGFTVQGHFLWHLPVTKSESIRAYYGFGGQINSRRYYPPRLGGEYESALSLGPSGIAGLEFFPTGKTYSIFLETGVYVELLQNPFFLSLNSGLGLRYNF